MPYRAWFRCIAGCSGEYPLTKPLYRCPTCGDLLEVAQQASAQVAAGGGTLREVDFTNQLAVLSQRIAKNANSLVSSDEIDPEVAFLLGKDSGSFRDILNGLLKGSEPLRLSGVRNDEARSTLIELQKRFVPEVESVDVAEVRRELFPPAAKNVPAAR